MRILLVTQWFDPEPAFKGLLFAKKLKSLGHEVEVLTGFPNYPGGKIYPGYRVKLFQRETMDGITVLRTWLYPSHDRSGLRRIGNYVSFALSSALFWPFLLRRPDLIYLYHPPATAALPALVGRLVFGIPFVQDVQDLWPDTLGATGMVRAPAVMRWVGLWCRWVYASAERVVVLSHGFKRKLIERGVPAGKVHVIYNWADEEKIHLPDSVPEAAQKKLGLSGRFNIVFAGTMGKAQALDAVLEAARIVNASSSEIQFVFIGGGVERDSLREKARELSNVLFLERRPPSEIGEILALSNVLLVHLKKDPLFEVTIPSKIQAYMAAGKPILAAIDGDAAGLVAQAQAGVICAPEDAAALAAAALRMAGLPSEELARMGASGKEFYRTRLSLAEGVRNFDLLFRGVRRRSRVYSFSKRLVDILVSGLSLLLLSPLLLVLTIMIRIRLGRPAMFRQERPGKWGRRFVIHKFRTMTDERDSAGELLSDERRLTPFGQWLRRLSLDELPQLWNVLKGDLSLVGPRPLLVRYLDRYDSEQARRHDVKPGITGWAQVNGRNALSWGEKFKLDVWYVDHSSFRLDLKILWMTFRKVFKREGISRPGDATMTEFLGNDSKR